MKHTALIKILSEKGYHLVRNGGKHDIYSNGLEDIPIPRHREVNEKLARHILKKVGK